jgi:DNA polymerase III alpha subunit (gram-positive type)
VEYQKILKRAPKDCWAKVTECYVSTDIEADGPIPGPNSMLSFGSAAFLADGTMISTFSRNLEALEGAQAEPSTAAWWLTQPEAWAACRQDLVTPVAAMKAYYEWLKELPGKPVFVGYPATYDCMWIHWYLIRFCGENPMSFSGLDIKTFAMVLLKSDFRESTKRNMPKRWFGKTPHNHVALDDAIGQGQLFCNMLKENRR